MPHRSGATVTTWVWDREGAEAQDPAMAATAVLYDPFAPAFHEDPYPVLAELREHEPMHRTGLGIYVLTRHEDVFALLRDRRLGRDIPPELVAFAAGTGPMAEFFDSNLLNKEAPDHTRLRKLMVMPFTPKLIRDLRASIEVLVDDLLDAAGDEEIDVVRDLGAILPVLVICELLGLPSEDRERVRPWATALADASTTIPTPDARAAGDMAILSFREYFERKLPRLKANGRGLLAQLAVAEMDGQRLRHDELIMNAVLLFFAGFETTTNLIGNGMLALLSNPDEMRRLRDDQALLSTAVDELLRYDTPVQSALRYTHDEVETASGTIKRNRVIELSLAGANRDQRAFARPDRLDVGRVDNPHVAFGSGVHFCLGSHLARLEGEVAFGKLLARYRSIEQAGAPVRKTSPSIRGLESLPGAVKR
jgi:cytochrome P450